MKIKHHKRGYFLLNPTYRGILMKNVKIRTFGNLKEAPVKAFCLTNENGMSVEIIEYGARIRSLLIPTKNGMREVTVGFDSLDSYLDYNVYFGAILGRTANRTAGASFSLDGKRYQLSVNAGTAHLHGGIQGFDRVLWHGEDVSDQYPAVRFSYTAEDMEEGYPGRVHVSVTYTLTEDNHLLLDFSACSEQTSPVDMTTHVYLNLNGVPEGTVENEVVQIHASRYMEKDPTMNVTGKLISVDGTNFDLRTPVELGKVAGPNVFNPILVLDGDADSVREIAKVSLPDESCGYTISATGHALQVFNAYGVSADLKSKGVETNLPVACGLCLEPMGFPNAVNLPHLPQNLLRPGEQYSHHIRFAFWF